MASAEPHIAVVGAGVTGLVAAEVLSRDGAVVTVYEAGSRAGGQLRSVPFAGHRVDVGAEALHVDPGLGELIDRLALTDRLVRATPGTTWIWTRRGRRRLPAGVGPAGPSRLWPVARSGILGPAALARAALEPAVPRLAPAGGADGDVSVGDYLSHRFGHRLVDALVDPVLGTLHAGDVSTLSLRAATPYLAAQADRSRSLLVARRGGSTGPPPSFATFPGGLTTLVDALVRSTVDRGGELRLGEPVTSVVPDGDSVRVTTADGTETFDGAVLAVPAAASSTLLGDSIGTVATTSLGQLRSASVVTVLAAYPVEEVLGCPALRANGLLVASDLGRLLKAATFLGSKWPHLRDPDHFLVRLSAGRIGGEDPTRLDDDELVARLHRDLADATGIPVTPSVTLVQRWPRAMAQLEVGHLGRVGGVARELAARGPVVLAGAPYEGVGVASCVRSGTAAARRLLGSPAGRLDAA
jgi:oxygen-dependent protoporphyrinogen oxidase